MDYKEIEDQALDIVRLEVPRVTTWQREWTNQARLEIQRRESFRAMARLYPTEAAIGSTFVTAPGVRRVEAPERFKEEVRELESGLFLVKQDEHIPIEKLPWEAIAHRYSIVEEAEPEAYHVIREGDGTAEKIYFELWPKPDDVYSLRLHAYFYLPDLPDTDLAGKTDFLTTNYDPLVVRDALIREAFVALQMWDLALRHEAARKTRSARADKHQRDRELPENLTLVPHLRSGGRGEISRRREEGWPW